jgi:SAM-dependent methyltransferase
MTKSLLTKTCIVDDGELIEILDLGMHPFADTFIPSERLYESEPIFPLICGLCTKCGLVQLMCLTNPAARYGQYEYSYTSSNSEYARNHWSEFAIETSLKSKPLKNILEIGSNDGFLLSKYAAQGHSVLGVDSSSSMAQLAMEQGIETLNRIFTFQVAEELAASKPGFDLIVANNVLNHSNNPLDFLSGVEILLSPEGKFVFEVPYWLSSIKTGNFDQIYHEHISYFTIFNVTNLVRLTNLNIQSITLNNYHGGSLRITLSKLPPASYRDWEPLALIEAESKLLSLDTYVKFKKIIDYRRNKTLSQIYLILANQPNSTIILAGAAAKANTFINYYSLNSTTIHCITDSSLHKIGKYTPVSRIPILPDSAVKDFENLYVLPTAWNIREIIMRSIVKLNPNAKELICE